MLDKLKKMTRGDEERMQLYIDNYIRGMIKNLREINEALEEEKYHDIGTIVHTAKPMFTVLGFDDMWKLANHVEMGINRRYDPEMIKEHILDLIKDIEGSIEQLKDFEL